MDLEKFLALEEVRKLGIHEAGWERILQVLDKCGYELKEK